MKQITQVRTSTNNTYGGKTVMANFNYEWWTVSVKCLTGTYPYEFKAKNKQNVIRQIKKLEKEDFSIVEIFWDTLKLDRVGYQRLS